MTARVGFVGLGVMGAPMAGHLLRAYGSLSLWSRTPSKAEPLAAEGATLAANLAELGTLCDVVFLCVNRTEDVDECLSELIQSAAPGTLFVDHSTISPVGAVEIHKELESKGFRFVDAPITGGSMGAEKGQLTVFCGGEEKAVEDAISAMKPYTKRAERVGGPGSGQMMKMANQIAVGGALLVLCEALSFAKKAGLNLQQTRDLLSGGAAGSWAFDNYGPKILAEDWSPGFSVKNQRKDFAYCLEAAAQLQAAVPATELVDRLLAQTQETLGGEVTTAALYETLLAMEPNG